MKSKILVKSKIFWLAVVNFVLSLVGGFGNVDYNLEVGKQILNLDWTNIGQALLSAWIIVSRWFFTSTTIGGLLEDKELSEL